MTTGEEEDGHVATDLIPADVLIRRVTQDEEPSQPNRYPFPSLGVHLRALVHLHTCIFRQPHSRPSILYASLSLKLSRVLWFMFSQRSYLFGLSLIMVQSVMAGRNAVFRSLRRPSSQIVSYASYRPETQRPCHNIRCGSSWLSPMSSQNRIDALSSRRT